MRLDRSLGVQLHPTSLPGGRLGPEAYAFVDWLASAGATWWQVLPLNPPDAVGSPYTSASAFAAWGGLLADPDAPVGSSEARAFRDREAAWIRDWEAFAGVGAVEEQVRFEREWSALRAHARARGVRSSATCRSTWRPAAPTTSPIPSSSSPSPRASRGRRPTASTPGGQLWGNPLYDWAALAAAGYRWWIERMRRVLALVDRFRIDHFRGFAALLDGACREPRTRAQGWWSPGPGLRSSTRRARSSARCR